MFALKDKTIHHYENDIQESGFKKNAKWMIIYCDGTETTSKRVPKYVEIILEVEYWRYDLFRKDPHLILDGFAVDFGKGKFIFTPEKEFQILRIVKDPLGDPSPCDLLNIFNLYFKDVNIIYIPRPTKSLLEIFYTTSTTRTSITTTTTITTTTKTLETTDQLFHPKIEMCTPTHVDEESSTILEILATGPYFQDNMVFDFYLKDGEFDQRVSTSYISRINTTFKVILPSQLIPGTYFIHSRFTDQVFKSFEIDQGAPLVVNQIFHNNYNNNSNNDTNNNYQPLFEDNDENNYNGNEFTFSNNIRDYDEE